jgi:hypothetical protein
MNPNPTQQMSPQQIKDALQLDNWRDVFPSAVAEASEPMGEFILHGTMPDGAEYWENEKYQVTVRRFTDDPVFRSRGGMVQLGISTADGTARHDWRDFQAIKNRFAGDEAEAFELYPAESRLLDPSNYYILWCFPQTRIRVGHNVRRIFTAAQAPTPQRAFPDEVKP